MDKGTIERIEKKFSEIKRELFRMQDRTNASWIDAVYVIPHIEELFLKVAELEEALKEIKDNAGKNRNGMAEVEMLICCYHGGCWDDYVKAITNELLGNGLKYVNCETRRGVNLRIRGRDLAELKAMDITKEEYQKSIRDILES